MKTVILYKTKKGSTEEYAKILGKEFSFNVFEFDKFKDFNKYEKFIIMSGVYAGKIPLVSFLKKNWRKIKNKKITAIVVGMVDKEHIWSKINYFFIPFWIKNKIKYFKIMGRNPESKEKVDKKNLNTIMKYLSTY